MATQKLEVRKLGANIGAEILGADVRRLNEADWHQIYQSWIENNVICVRDQTLELDEFLHYSRRFGVIRPHPSKSTRHPDRPEVTYLGVNKWNDDGSLNESIYRRGGEGWHTDGAYDDVPFKATQLYALAIPSRGGDTLFASMYSAFDALPKDLKDALRGKHGAFTYGGRTRHSNALLNPEDRARAPAFHPILRKHPESGRMAMYFDPGKILYIEGLPADESEAIIDELTGHMIQADGQYRHKWRKGDVVIWDNRCSYHRAAADYPPEENRVHWRVSIKEK